MTRPARAGIVGDLEAAVHGDHAIAHPRGADLIRIPRTRLVRSLVVAAPILAVGCERAGGPVVQADPTFVGTEACRACHEAEVERWVGSDHDLAMDVATEASVLGDFSDVQVTFHGTTSRFFRRDGKFFVETERPDGELAEFEVTHTFGHDPLQQYLVPFPGGRLQALQLAWDRVERRWFHLQPDEDIPPGDWLHWTGAAQNWNGMCAECHSTNLVKGYDPETRTYATTFSDIDVGCEACHGPGSRHVAWAESASGERGEEADAGLVVSTADIAPARLVELCAPCHSRRAELVDYDHTGGETLDHFLPALLREGLYHADGQILDEVYVYGSFLQSEMYARGVTCSDCHDVHSLRLRREGNDLCLGCHEAQVYDTTDHHFHERIVDGLPSVATTCVACHMVERPYMVIDWRADHSFRVPRPDLTVEIGTPNACAQAACHADETAEWAADAYRRWYGEARRPHFGTAFAAARDGQLAAAELARLAASPLQPTIVRATALEELGRFPGPEAGEALAAGLAAPEPLLRHTAATFLPAATPEDLAAALGPRLSDPVRAVRMAAASRLAGLPPEALAPETRPPLARAIEEYRVSLDHSLDFAASGLNLGNLEAALGNAAAAEAAYRRALEIDALFHPARVNLAILYAGQGRLDEAERHLREVLAAEPGYADALYSLGLLLVETGEREEAVEVLGRAVRVRPGVARWRYNLGLLLHEMGRVDDAGEELREGLRLAPDDLGLLHAMAVHELGRGRLEEALALAERMIEIAPDEPIGRQVKAAVEAEIAGRAEPGRRR